MASLRISWSSAFVILINFLTFCAGAPIHNHDILYLGAGVFSSNLTIIFSASILLLCAVLVFGCTCCPHKNGHPMVNPHQHPIHNLNDPNFSQLSRPSEFAIFPPCSSVISLQPVQSSNFGSEGEKIIFEPLPDILPKRHVNGQNLAQSSKPAHFSALLKKKSSLHDWFDDPSSNFPRNQLQYLREIGNGWFGRVVEGEAQMIVPGQEKTSVMVKILREEASPSEHLYFLHEVRPYRDLQHINILKLLGRCLETDPSLLIMEHTIMDLKSYLIKHHDMFMKHSDVENEKLLRWALNITSGLFHMHEHGFTHTDLAAHNCFITPEHTIKIGDYGLSFDIFREDYYCLGDIALPIRWYSPETLVCSNTTIEAKETTKESNIWSLAVVFWELLECGKLPYADLNNEEVLQNVIIDRSVYLKAPQIHHPHKDQLFQVMQLCWNPPLMRPRIHEIEVLLRQICEHKDFLKSLASFEARWNALQSKPTVHDVSFKFENDFVTDSNSESLFLGDGNVSESSAFESGSDAIQVNSESYISASLRGLNGSFDEIENLDGVPSTNMVYSETLTNGFSTSEDTPNSLHKHEAVTPEQISEAIRDLDVMLATEARLLGVDSRSTTLERPNEKCKDNDSITQVQKTNEFYGGESADLAFDDQMTSKNPCYDLIVEEDDIIYEREITPSNSRLHLELENLPDSLMSPSIENPSLKISSESLSNENESDKILNGFKNLDRNCSSVSTPSDCEISKNTPSTFTLNSEESPSKDNIFDTFQSQVQPLPVPDIVIDSSTFEEEKNKDDDDEEDIKVEVPKPSLRKFRFVMKDELTKEVPNDKNIVFNVNKNLSNVHVENNSSVTGPRTSTPTRISDSPFNEDQLPNLDHSHDIHADVSSFVSCQSSITNSEHYESFANMSSGAISNADYETAASTFNVSHDSVFNNETNESMQDTMFLDSKTLIETEDSNSKSNTAIENISSKSSSQYSNSQNSYSSPYCLTNGEEIESGTGTSFQSSLTFFDNCGDIIPSTASKFTDAFMESQTADDQDQSSDTQKNIPLVDSTLSKEFPVIELNDGEETHVSDTISDSLAFKKQCEWSIIDDTTEAFTFPNELTQNTSDTASESNAYNGPMVFENLGVDTRLKSSISDSVLFTKQQLDPMDAAYDNPLIDRDSHHMNHSNQSIDQELALEDLETEQSYIISEDYDDEQLEDDDVLKIDIETNEAILVDSSETLIGFVPSRSIEMLQECNDIVTHLESRPKSNSLTIKELDSTSTSPISYSSKNETPEGISSQCNGIVTEPLNDTPESSPATITSTSEDLLSDHEKPTNEQEYQNQYNNNNNNEDIKCEHNSPDLYNDVIYSTQPTKSVVWHSDETLDVIDDNESQCNMHTVIIEGQEIMAGSKNLNEQLKSDNIQFGSSDFLDRLAVSPSESPHNSVSSTPCRDIVYTPDFESESDESSSSCSSTSGSFECIHNKFKNVGNISLASENAKEDSPIILNKPSEEASPMKIFSTTWDCHATPNKSLLKSPEKKALPMRKSVSFHEEPQLVFQYPPASDSSEDDFIEDADEFSFHVDYTSYADWDLQANDDDEIPEEMIEIEELESEPYNRSLYRGSRPLSGNAMYTITGFSEDDEDLHDSPSQFSPFNIEQSTLDRKSPVRIFTHAKGLSFIKENINVEEEITVEEIPVDSKTEDLHYDNMDALVELADGESNNFEKNETYAKLEFLETESKEKEYFQLESVIELPENESLQSKDEVISKEDICDKMAKSESNLISEKELSESDVKIELFEKELTEFKEMPAVDVKVLENEITALKECCKIDAEIELLKSKTIESKEILEEDSFVELPESEPFKSRAKEINGVSNIESLEKGLSKIKDTMKNISIENELNDNVVKSTESKNIHKDNIVNLPQNELERKQNNEMNVKIEQLENESMKLEDIRETKVELLKTTSVDANKNKINLPDHINIPKDLPENVQRDDNKDTTEEPTVEINSDKNIDNLLDENKAMKLDFEVKCSETNNSVKEFTIFSEGVAIANEIICDQKLINFEPSQIEINKEPIVNSAVLTNVIATGSNENISNSLKANPDVPVETAHHSNPLNNLPSFQNIKYLARENSIYESGSENLISVDSTDVQTHGKFSSNDNNVSVPSQNLKTTDAELVNINMEVKNSENKLFSLNVIKDMNNVNQSSNLEIDENLDVTSNEEQNFIFNEETIFENGNLNNSVIEPKSSKVIVHNDTFDIEEQQFESLIFEQPVKIQNICRNEVSLVSENSNLSLNNKNSNHADEILINFASTKLQSNEKIVNNEKSMETPNENNKDLYQLFINENQSSSSKIFNDSQISLREKNLNTLVELDQFDPLYYERNTTEDSMANGSEIKNKIESTPSEKMEKVGENIVDIQSNAGSSLPAIVITNIEESLVDEELEEFLNGHFQFYENGNNESDFTVTSKYSESPFEDPFGFSNQGAEDIQFVEAINLHNSVQNLIDLSEAYGDSLNKDEGLKDSPEKSSSLPVMNEEQNFHTESSVGFSSL